ncbi:MAG: hypothetical protein ACQESC_02020 [Nanobdellota archaeon]
MALNTIPTNIPIAEVAGSTGLLGAIAAVGFMMVIGWLVIYIYTSIAMMYTARRLKTQPEWLAWIPIARNALLPKMVKMHWWPVLLLVGAIIFSWVPVLGTLLGIAFGVFYIYWLWKICEARKMPGWIAILIIVPVVGQLWMLVLWGLLAWNK